MTRNLALASPRPPHGGPLATSRARLSLARMSLTRVRGLLQGLGALAFVGLTAAPAHAVPAFARQTGQDCVACHVGGFGPQLTPFGRAFKLGGYTLKGGSAKHDIPLSAMLVASYTHTTADNSAPPAGFSANDNVTALQQASVFLAGRLSDHVGVLAQATYSDPGSQNIALDNSDLRFANEYKIGSTSGIFGVSLNNNPTVSDVWNTVPAWQFGFMTSPFGAGYGQTPIIEDLGGHVLGATVYTLVDNHWYGELGLYHQMSNWWGNRLHAGGSADPLNDAAGVNGDLVAGGGMVTGYAPYWRFNYSNSVGSNSYEFGVLGMQTKLNPQNPNGDPTISGNGPDETYKDLGVDASYQYFGDTGIWSVNGLYMHERQDFTQSYSTGATSNNSDTLNAMNVNAAYWYQNTYGATIQFFNVTGSTDPNLYNPNTNAQTSGVTWEFDWNPFGKSWVDPEKNLRLGVQYTTYNKFAGSSQGASSNNSLYVYVWTAI